MLHAVARALAKKVLERATSYPWSVQGLGMYRLLLSEDRRLRMHVWDGRAAYPGVSTIHSHPWDFKSLILSGRVRDVVWRVSDKRGPFSLVSEDGRPYRKQEIVCGPGGSAIGEASLVFIEQKYSHVYVPGDTYDHEASAFHESFPDQGTVTIIERDFRDDTERAFVLFPDGESWVSAEPRDATEDEVRAMAAMALDAMALDAMALDAMALDAMALDAMAREPTEAR